ncbi:replication initiation protein [Defluviimonas sp. WL0024]|uniref:Replication initiation protein n=1 Tax=Albidovulum salinarum TaxID=2984153 RepID=A0ABT2X9K0_9RHOB|nr:replication initiation protein [Defluviimonas sp. WL0024]MCU9850619.1 replication initiation protein [Defluviimonas sp. WL0024]
MAKPPMTVTDALRMNRDNPDAIIAAGEVVDMRFQSGNQLSLRAAKLFCLLVQEAGIAIADDKQHRIPYSVLNETFRRSKAELLDAIYELHCTMVSVKVTSQNGRDFTKSGPIIADIEREDDELDSAEIRFEFSKALRQVIANSTHWAALSRRAVLAFESKYSLRFYLFLSLRAGLRKTSEEFSLDDLREMLGMEPGTLPRWQDFRRFVLDKAQAEINHLAGFRMGYEPIKIGRKFAGVRLFWGLKGRDELIEAHKELERPRVGRTARREGKVEQLAQDDAILRERLAASLASAPYGNGATVAQPASRNGAQPA